MVERDRFYTLLIRCASCRGRVTLQLSSEEAVGGDSVQSWICPFCLSRNQVRVVGAVLWATKGHDKPTDQ